VSIGERRKPQPKGQLGFLRLDTVHQGDQPNGGEKSVYHINAVDEVTQWQVAAQRRASRRPIWSRVLEHMPRQFPFRILGFHTDNGSEFINKTVAQLLEKLRVEQTKSRPRQSGDNGLVETKNGAVIRKHIGYGYIDASDANSINDFYHEYFNPYLNYHRPCAQADVKIDEKGRKRVSYKRYQTPLETLSLLGQTRTIPARRTEYERAEKGCRHHQRWMRRGGCSRQKPNSLSGCGSPRRTDGRETGPRKWRSMESSENDSALFSDLPTDLGNRSNRATEK
jgi:hypothetical protein